MARVANNCIWMDTQNDSGHFRFGGCVRWADGDGRDGESLNELVDMTY